MYTKQEVKRDYPMSDAELIITAGEKKNNILRDSIEFAGYDINDPQIADYDTQITAFQDLPTDIELLGNVTEQTELKLACENELKGMIRDIMVRVALKFPENSSKYRRFGTIGINEMTNSQLQDCAYRVNRVGLNLLSQIGNGLNNDMLVDVKAKALEYHQLRLEVSEATDNRDDATEDRIEAGNALYKKMMDLCKIGQAIWVNKDEAKHNDYIVYETPEATPPVTPPTP